MADPLCIEIPVLKVGGGHLMSQSAMSVDNSEAEK